jgi:hypothetical protein
MSGTKRLHRLPLARSFGWVIVVGATVAVGTYLLAADSHGPLAFPLDDAWIHQTYARNLAETGQLAFRPGQPSAGSTSPAWSFLLSVGYLLGVDYRLWAYLMGGLALAATAWLSYRLLLRLAPSRPTAALLAGLFCALEWHLVWAAASGMETMLFTALSLALLEAFFSHLSTRSLPQGPASLHTEQVIVGAVGIGLMGGLLALTRPEGLVLAGLVIVALFALPALPDRYEVKPRALAAGASLLALGVLLAPYLAFNLNTAGSLFPNTFYAKQAEYQVYLKALSLPARFWRVLSPTLVGAQVLLLPGFCYAVYRLFRRHNWPAMLPLVWWLAFLSIYALRLPVDYQHGRYLMPTIPLLILYGTWGTAEILRPRSLHLALRVASRAAPLALAALALVFWVRGAMAYRDDVGVIQGEMVATAQWLNEHTTPDDVIAVHDIGAVGYLTDRHLLDLAGLITPEVIPFIANAQQLMDWMVAEGATYAVFFPDFSPTYAQLSADPRLQLVHCTGYAWTRQQGLQNMCVFQVVP